MRIRTQRVAILVASGALALGGVGVAAPALAGHGPFGSPTVTAAQPVSGWNNGNGPGSGAGNGTGARAETQHQAAVRTLLERYSLADPTAGKAVGQFSDPAVQATYDRLLAQGSTGLAAALQVGRQVETTDIADLRAALDGLTAPDVTQVYSNLLDASQKHLAAFQNWSTR